MKAIAMKCTQEQFDAVMPKLKKGGFSINSVTGLDEYPYLFVNIFNSTISNLEKTLLKPFIVREIHETWNEKIFLEACGIEVEETFSITAKQLRQLTDPKLKEWFPYVFKVKLEVGKWMKTPNGGFYCPQEKLKNGFGCYGFSPVSKEWIERKVSEKEAKNDVEATKQEVLEALENEAVKRGFVEGNVFEGMEDSSYIYKCKGFFEVIPQEELVDSMKGKTVMQLNRKDIFQNGVWATIIPTCTRAEAEKLLNKKIID